MIVSLYLAQVSLLGGRGMRERFVAKSRVVRGFEGWAGDAIAASYCEEPTGKGGCDGRVADAKAVSYEETTGRAWCGAVRVARARRSACCEVPSGGECEGRVGDARAAYCEEPTGRGWCEGRVRDARAACCEEPTGGGWSVRGVRENRHEKPERENRHEKSAR